VIEIVIEIGVEQTRFFNVTGFTVPIFVTEIVIEFFKPAVLVFS